MKGPAPASGFLACADCMGMGFQRTGDALPDRRFIPCPTCKGVGSTDVTEPKA